MLEKVANILMALVILAAMASLVHGGHAYDQGYKAGRASVLDEQERTPWP